MLDDVLAVLASADDLYKRRGEPGAVKQSVELLARLPGANDLYEVQWRLGRALFFLGQAAATQAAKQQLHAAGIGAGKRAVALVPGRVEGRFWLGVNLALFAEASGGLRAIRAVVRARRELKRAAKIDESYHAAGPLRVLGRLHHKSPWFLGGSLTRSKEYFDRALALAPNNSVTLLYAAEQALDSGDPARAASLLGRIIERCDDETWSFENQRDKALAKSMIERLRFPPQSP